MRQLDVATAERIMSFSVLWIELDRFFEIRQCLLLAAVRNPGITSHYRVTVLDESRGIVWGFCHGFLRALEVLGALEKLYEVRVGIVLIAGSAFPQLPGFGELALFYEEPSQLKPASLVLGIELDGFVVRVDDFLDGPGLFRFRKGGTQQYK